MSLAITEHASFVSTVSSWLWEGKKEEFKENCIFIDIVNIDNIIGIYW